MGNGYLTLEEYVKEYNMNSCFFYEYGCLIYSSYTSSQIKRILNDFDLAEVEAIKNGDEAMDDALRKKLKRKFFEVFDDEVGNIIIDDIYIENLRIRHLRDISFYISIYEDKNNNDLDIYVVYDVVNNKLVRIQDETVIEYFADFLNSTLTKGALKMVSSFLTKYLEKAIKDAISKQLVDIYFTGWDFNGYERKLLAERKKTTLDEIRKLLNNIFLSREKFMMLLYTLYSVSIARIKVSDEFLSEESMGLFFQPVLNIYGKDTKKRNSYANLYCNLLGEVEKPNMIKAADSISLSRDGFETDRLLLYRDVPIIITKKGTLNSNSYPLKLIRKQLGKRFRFQPVVLSDKKLVSDYIINVNTSFLEDINYFNEKKDAYRDLVYGYIEWLKKKDIIEYMCSYVEFKANNIVFTTEEAENIFGYFDSALLVFLQFIEDTEIITPEVGEEFEKLGEKYLLEVIENENIEMQKESQDHYGLIHKIFREEILNQENMEHGDVILQTDPVDDIECYYFTGNWWIKKIREAGIQCSDNEIKKMAYDAGVLDHFKTGKTNVRSTYTVQRRLRKGDKKSYYRVRKSSID